MYWRNRTDAYGLVAILFHWLVAVAVVFLFGLGLWMVDLSYYDANYRSSVDLHRSIGVLLFGALALRLLWRLFNPAPRPHGRRWERRAAALMHWALYLLLFATMAAGYLITTADGRSVDVFGLFQVPATLTGRNQEDRAGDLHEILAWGVIVLASVHALAALKHALIDRDGTLRRMLWPRREERLRHSINP